MQLIIEANRSRATPSKHCRLYQHSIVNACKLMQTQLCADTLCCGFLTMQQSAGRVETVMSCINSCVKAVLAHKVEENASNGKARWGMSLLVSFPYFSAEHAHYPQESKKPRKACL